MLVLKSFYLIRHGQSEANVSGKAAGGGVDSPLTALGRQQALKLAPLIPALMPKPSIIYHSPMQRARDTAALLNSVLNLPMVEVMGLQEHELGEWEGQMWEDIKHHVMNNVRPKGGENRSDFAERVKPIINKILDAGHETPPMIVAHGGTFHSIAHLYDWQSDRVENCHLHRFDPHDNHAAFPWHIHELNPGHERFLEVRSSQSAPL